MSNRDPSYEMSGLQVVMHYARNLKNFGRMKVQATLYEGVQIVKQDNHQDCNWATTSVDKQTQMIAPKGSRVEIGLDGQIQIFKPSAQELAQPREYGQNVPGVAGSDEFVLPVN